MRDEYDFSKARKNSYSTQLKKSITILLDEDYVSFLKPFLKKLEFRFRP